MVSTAFWMKMTAPSPSEWWNTAVWMLHRLPNDETPLSECSITFQMVKHRCPNGEYHLSNGEHRWRWPLYCLPNGETPPSELWTPPSERKTLLALQATHSFCIVYSVWPLYIAFQIVKHRLPNGEDMLRATHSLHSVYSVWPLYITFRMVKHRLPNGEHCLLNGEDHSCCMPHTAFVLFTAYGVILALIMYT